MCKVLVAVEIALHQRVIKLNDLFQHLVPVLIGLLLGVSYGIAVGALAGFAYHDRYGWYFGLVVGLAMTFSMMVASCMASIEPFVLRRLGVDPATATGPMITTTTDLLSNAFYFTLASWLLLGR